MMSLSVLVARASDGVGDRIELRLAVVFHVGRLDLFLVHARRLRHLREQHGFGGLGSARHRGQHARPRVLQRNLRELRRQLRRGERPGPGEIRGREPAPGDQEVDGAGPAQPEHVAHGVLHPEQVGRAVHQQVVRRAGHEDQLSRCGADEDGRRLAARLLARQARLHVLPVFVGWQLLEALRQRAGRRPRSFNRRGLQPDLLVAEVQRVGRPVLEQVPVRVDGVLQIVVLDGTPDRFIVDVHQYCRRRAVEDLRRVGLHALHVLRDDLALVDAGEDAIERRSRARHRGWPCRSRW